MNLEFFSNFPPESKIWLYSSDRIFNDNEISQINKDLKNYTEQWFSHGKALHAAACMINPFILCFVIDSTKVHASGCSIDDSVKFLKKLNEKYKNSFFDRIKIWTKINNDFKLLNYSELDDYSNAEIFNLQAKSLIEFKNKPFVLVSEYLNSFQKV